ncbi:hypothetical protein [Nostoc sp.]
MNISLTPELEQLVKDNFYHWYKPRDRSENLPPNRVLELCSERV